MTLPQLEHMDAVGEANKQAWRYKFAGMAMQGYSGDPELNSSFEDLAEYAVKQADALLAELEKPIPNLDALK